MMVRFLCLSLWAGLVVCLLPDSVMALQIDHDPDAKEAFVPVDGASRSTNSCG